MDLNADTIRHVVKRDQTMHPKMVNSIIQSRSSMLWPIYTIDTRFVVS